MEMISSYTADGLKADEIFGMMHTYLAQGNGKDLIGKVNAIYAFEITKTKGGKVEAIFEIDLKNGQGTVKKGKPDLRKKGASCTHCGRHLRCPMCAQAPADPRVFVFFTFSHAWRGCAPAQAVAQKGRGVHLLRGQRGCHR